jgi:putative nucleotidyltransferase with HDIG domain
LLFYTKKSLKVHQNFSRLSGLYQISTSISKILDLELVLRKVLDKAIELLEAEDGSLMLIQPETSELGVVVAQGQKAEFRDETPIKLGESITGRVAQEGRPMLLKRGVKEAFSTSEKAPENLPSVMSVPLSTKDQVIGVLNISGKTGDRDFTPDDLDLMQTLAANAAIAIDNAKLYHEVQGNVRQLSALFELSTIIVSTLDPKEVLEKVLDNAIQLLGARDGSLMLLNEETGELEIEVAYGLPEKIIKETRIRIGEGIAGKVALEGKPRLLRKGIKEAESKTETVENEVPTAMSVPLNSKDKTIGVLNVKGKTTDENFNKSDMELLTMLGSLAAIAIENAELHKNLEDLFVNSIRALANAIEARDPYTRGHSERVTEYSVKIAEYFGIGMEEVKKIRYAALLHDIGKINIKEEILNKPGRLTDEEFMIMHNHPTMGAKIMEPVKEFREMLPYLYHHHERYGAGGYPDGVRGEQIPLPARILAVADAFDAMTTDRPYRKALSLEIALGELQKNSGTQFDPKVVKTFLRICDEESEWIKDMTGTFKNGEY